MTDAPLRHADGVYLDLPLADYLADDALSGSAFKKLLSDPAALAWERPQNPLWEAPASRPRARGSAAHCAILEGLGVYEARYLVEPDRGDYPDACDTAEDLREWLRPHKDRDPKGVKLTGAKDELIAQCRAIAEANALDFGTWAELRAELIEGRACISAADDAYVRLSERFVRADPAFAPLLTGGLAEVSIFWTEGDLRFKARLDYLTAHTLLDLKTYGQAPRRGRDLRQQCVADACWYGYDLQAVHNARAIQHVTEAKANICHPVTMPRELDVFVELARAWRAKPPVFRWLFLRMGGAPTGISIPFRSSDGQWQEARAQIDHACAIYRELRDRFGDGLWLFSHGEQEIGDFDWPPAAFGGGEIAASGEEAP